ncbi:hypothetical protein V6N12_024010 [Hibiscus sabdariffa]|uniref:RNase H type-1 domain-containing protein n=1 Tax=Hibiscus sabdariffa TaxID=183260 RepID=A0ABR2FZA6_9ROSI
MTNLERYKRTLTNDPLCPLCHRPEESTLHTLRDCVNLRQIWQKIVPQTLSNTFFSMSIKDWLRQNLCSNILFQNNISWKLVFASILWQFWKNRNDAVFAASSASVECVLNRSNAWAQYYNDGWLKATPLVNPSSTSTSWSNLEPGWFCLNVDSVVSLKTEETTIGGLLRDNAGNFIFDFSKFIGCANSLHAELWSLHVGLQLAWDHEVDFLQVQIDCKHVLQLLQDPYVESYSIFLVRNIHQFWRWTWFIDLIWILCSGNKVADKRPRLANHSSFDLSFISTSHAALCDVLIADNLTLSL